MTAPPTRPTQAIMSHTTVRSSSNRLRACSITYTSADLVNGANIDQTVSVNGKVVSTLSWRTYFPLEHLE